MLEPHLPLWGGLLPLASRLPVKLVLKSPLVRTKRI